MYSNKASAVNLWFSMESHYSPWKIVFLESRLYVDQILSYNKIQNTDYYMLFHSRWIGSKFDWSYRKVCLVALRWSWMEFGMCVCFFISENVSWSCLCLNTTPNKQWYCAIFSREKERKWWVRLVGKRIREGVFSNQSHCRFVVTCFQADKVAFPDCSHPRLSYLTPPLKNTATGEAGETRHRSLIPVRRWLLIRSG